MVVGVYRCEVLCPDFVCVWGGVDESRLLVILAGWYSTGGLESNVLWGIRHNTLDAHVRLVPQSTQHFGF